MNSLNKKTIEDIDVSGKRVLVRCDFNVPLKDGVITNDKRIVAALPTIQYLIDHQAKVILCSHLGRPKGEYKEEFSLAPVAARLSELLGQPVELAQDKEVVGENAKALSFAMHPGDVILLENVRFRKEETKNEEAFSKELAGLADIYVNDAFGTAHRAHCSTTGVASFLPAVCGYLIQKEISVMGQALNNPKRPLVAILGGAKVSDKIGVINNLLEKVDTLIVGGGMAYTFFKAQGYGVGASLCEDDKVELAKEMLSKAQQKGVRFLLPVDNKLGDKFAEDCATQFADSDSIPEGWMGMDIGPKTIELFCSAVQDAGTVIWNGPMGVFEFPAFAGYSGGSKSDRCFQRNLDHRRRRQRCSGNQAGLCRQNDPHLHRWRRFPGIFGRSGAAGHRCSQRQIIAPLQQQMQEKCSCICFLAGC